MGTAERRSKLLRVLCRRRHDTMTNLANEFGVSVRTIIRDIDALSETEPIYTQCGRYGGGVYVVEGYTMDRMYMTDQELSVLHKLASMSQSKSICELEEDEFHLINMIIMQYTKPNVGREK